jgi:hypothetical protein
VVTTLISHTMPFYGLVLSASGELYAAEIYAVSRISSVGEYTFVIESGYY